MVRKVVLGNNDNLPEHIAIIMDGNGRWAQSRGLPRIDGHKAGARVLLDIVKYSIKTNIKILTVYAFSSENWMRPQSEVSMLMSLFECFLARNFAELCGNNIRLRVIGDLSALPVKLHQSMVNAMQQTMNNSSIQLIVALNYGGRWDITNACKELSKRVVDGDIKIESIDESMIGRFMAMSDLPEPDLFIRTGGEKRISNYLLWQLAYTELYFDDCLWPNFSTENFSNALGWYAERQRRFGCTSEQMIQHA